MEAPLRNQGVVILGDAVLECVELERLHTCLSNPKYAYIYNQSITYGIYLIYIIEHKTEGTANVIKDLLVLTFMAPVVAHPCYGAIVGV